MAGQRVIRDELTAIFADHLTGRYVGIPRDVRPLDADTAILHARSGVVPAGATQSDPTSTQSNPWSRSAGMAIGGSCCIRTRRRHFMAGRSSLRSSPKS